MPQHDAPALGCQSWVLAMAWLGLHACSVSLLALRMNCT